MVSCSQIDKGYLRVHLDKHAPQHPEDHVVAGLRRVDGHVDLEEVVLPVAVGVQSRVAVGWGEEERTALEVCAAVGVCDVGVRVLEYKGFVLHP